MNNRLYYSFIVFLFFLASLGQTYAQKKMSKDTGVLPGEIKTNLMILDSNKQFVSGINKEEIKIFEDGIEQEVTYFAEKKQKLNLGFIMDNSGSSRFIIKEMAWVASSIVLHLDQSDEAFVVRFVSSDKINILQDWTSKKPLLLKGLKTMRVEGGRTALFDGIYLSAQKIRERALKKKDERYALFLISDIEERNSWYKYEDVVKLFDGVDVPLFILSYAKQLARTKRLAISRSHFLSLDTGGANYLLPGRYKKKHLKEFIADFSRDLRANYVVGYKSSKVKNDGKVRKLRIEVENSDAGEKREVLFRTEFLVPKKRRVKK